MLLEELGTLLKEDLNLERPLEKDSSGWLVCTLNSEQTLLIKEEDPLLYVRAYVGPFPEKKAEEFCLAVMKGNFLGQGTGENVLGLSEDEKFLTLSCALPYEENYAGFKSILEAFANYLGYWQEELTIFAEA